MSCTTRLTFTLLTLDTNSQQTFHESSVADGTDLCEQMFETLCDMLQNATRYTPLALQKALVVCRHLLTYGAERVINEGICLGRPVEHLLNYNVRGSRRRPRSCPFG